MHKIDRGCSAGWEGKRHGPVEYMLHTLVRGKSDERASLVALVCTLLVVVGSTEHKVVLEPKV